MYIGNIIKALSEKPPNIPLSELRHIWKYAKLVNEYDEELRFWNIWNSAVEEKVLIEIIRRMGERNNMLQDQLVAAQKEIRELRRADDQEVT